MPKKCVLHFSPVKKNEHQQNLTLLIIGVLANDSVLTADSCASKIIVVSKLVLRLIRVPEHQHNKICMVDMGHRGPCCGGLRKTGSTAETTFKLNDCDARGEN